MMELNRRDFMLASTLLAGGRHLSASEPALRFPTAPRERLSVASYSLRAVMDTPRNRARNPQFGPPLDIMDFPRLVAKRYNVPNIEVLGTHLRSTEPAYLDEFRSSVKAAGARMVDLGAPGMSLYDPDAAKRAAAIDSSKKWIDVAVALDCPSVRLHVSRAGEAAPDAGRASQTLGPVVAYGASKGVILLLENDDLIAEDAFFLAKIIDQVNSPWLRGLPDFCNSMRAGNEQLNYDAVTAMFRRAYHVAHLKDSEIAAPGKVFRVDLGRMFGIAKASGYKGYFSVEFEGEGDPYVEVGRLVAEGLKFLA
jgi:sugar phosphate isomerase/epimerase